MNIWHYLEDTGELCGMSVADPCPIVEGEWLIPAYATPIEPPAPMVGTTRVFTGTEWIHKPI